MAILEKALPVKRQGMAFTFFSLPRISVSALPGSTRGGCAVPAMGPQRDRDRDREHAQHPRGRAVGARRSCPLPGRAGPPAEGPQAQAEAPRPPAGVGPGCGAGGAAAAPCAGGWRRGAPRPHPCPCEEPSAAGGAARTRSQAVLHAALLHSCRGTDRVSFYYIYIFFSMTQIFISIFI